MKIVLMSDLHLEMGALEKPLPTGDVLILAGDITLAGALDPTCDLHARLPHIRERTLHFISECTSRFDKVFCLIGNHEAYNYSLSEAPKALRKYLPGVTLLHDSAVELLSDVILVGGTLWTDMGKGHDADLIGAALNDFRLVQYRERRFTPLDAMAMFKRTKALIAKTARDNTGKTIVVATHHAPSIKGVNPQHAHSRYNAGFFTDLEDLIAKHPNIRFWCHGHTHIQSRYQIAQCEVISNARGYHNREASALSFNPDCSFDPEIVAAGNSIGEVA